MTNSLPQYLFAVATRDGNTLGHISFAEGLFTSEEDAIAYVRGEFASLSGADVALAKGENPIQVRSLPVRGMANLIQTTPPESLEDVLIDLVYANDCCVTCLSELPLGSHVLDAALRCPECGTTFRYVWDGSLERLVWKWRTEAGTRARHEALIKPVGEMMRFIAERQRQQQQRLDDDTDDDEEKPPPGPVSVRDLPNIKDLHLS